MQNTSIHYFNRIIRAIVIGLSLLAIASSSRADTPDAQCQFSPHLTCYDLNGIELWAKPSLNDASKLASDSQRIYLNQNNQFFSLNLSNGETIWKANSGPDALYFFPILNQQAIYLARSDGQLEKRTATTGKLQWRKQPGSGWIYPPLVAQDQLITGGQDRTLWVINSGTGKTEASIELSQELVMPLISAHAQIIASTFDGAVSAYQLKAADNTQLIKIWQTQLASPVFDIQLSGDTLITADMGGTIRALNPLNGHIKWQQAIHKNALYWNVLHQQTLYSLSQSGLLSALNINSGELLEQQQITGSFSRPPIVRNESLVLFDTHGNTQQVLLETLNNSQATTLLLSIK